MAARAAGRRRLALAPERVRPKPRPGPYIKAPLPRVPRACPFPSPTISKLARDGGIRPPRSSVLGAPGIVCNPPRHAGSGDAAPGGDVERALRQPRSITSREAGGTAPMARQLSCGPLHTTRPSWSSAKPARLNGAEQSLDGGSELREALFQRRGKRIEPVRRGDEIFERLARHGVLDPHRNDRQALGDRPLDFALDLRRSFACCEKISTSTLAPVIAVTIVARVSIPGTMSRGRSSNGYRPVRASHRQRRPTPHPVRIADEDVVFHHPSPWRARSSRSRQSTMAVLGLPVHRFSR